MRHLLANVFNVLDESVGSSRRVAVAYSGGKDSTAVALLLREWIESRGRSDVDVLLINSDTLSEIPEMRAWTKTFMEEYVNDLKKLGVNASFKIVTPRSTDTFYWRVLVRGYPAPTYSFRWCVYLLKRKAALEIVNEPNSVVLMGHRDEESSARAQSLNSKIKKSLCPLNAGRCSYFYLMTEGKATKVYPIRDWKTADVWRYLVFWGKNRGTDLEMLFNLYGARPHGDAFMKARYGCWHCTLIKYQLGNLILGEGNLYFEAVRLMYRWISDIPEMRIGKNTGYSKLGALTAPARSFILYSLRAAEELSRVKLYGLDESRVQGYTLRQIFYEISEDEADKIIAGEEGTCCISYQRIYSMRDLRNTWVYRRELDKLIKLMRERAKTRSLIKRHVDEIISSLDSS